MDLSIRSKAFSSGSEIPRKYTCDGADVAPPLEFTGIPEDTRSLALIIDDPDAPSGTWTHWVVYALPPGTEALASGQALPSGTRAGRNDFRRNSYGGPCPPPGGPHRYFFKLYALDTDVDLPEGATRRQLLDAMAGHILAEAQLMGTYKRSA